MQALDLNTAQTRFRAWLDKRKFAPHKLRNALVGCIATIVLCEVSCYQMMTGLVKSGELPPFAPDLTIVVMASVETVLSPFISWLGYQRRRMMVVVLIPVMTITVISWLLLPKPRHRQVSEFCNGQNNSLFVGWFLSTIIRLSTILWSCVLFMVARIAIWCHGFAYLEEHGADRFSIHIGIVVVMRLLILTIGQRMLSLEIGAMQVGFFAGSFVIQFLQILYFMPSNTLKYEDGPKIPDEDRNFFSSMRRVLSNYLAMCQILALGFLSAGLWGYGYHNSDVIKAKYLAYEESNQMLLFTEVIQCLGTFMSVVYIGMKWSAPIRKEFCNITALSQSMRMGLRAVILLLIIGLALQSDNGRVAGAEDGHYITPYCSAECGCSPRWREFSPVCVVEDMTTYLSPCQAGCGGIENEGGIMVYKNCTCAIGGRAVFGACSEAHSVIVRGLHRMLYIVILTLGVLAMHAQSIILVKAVDARDKSVALGIAGSVVALFAFVLGHITFNTINAATCIWMNSERCHLNSRRFPLLLCGASAALVSVASAICLCNFIHLKIKARRKKEDTRL